MSKGNTLTQDRLRELLVYDQDTGAFTWRISVGGRGAANGNGKFKAGTIAGCFDGDGYRVIRVDGRLYRANRLAWLYMTGEWPKADVDHKFRNRSDDRWSMLRQLTRTENLQNSLHAKGRSGLRGAQFDSKSGKYISEIFVNGKRQRVGTFDAAEAAHEAYMTAKRRLHAGFAAEA